MKQEQRFIATTDFVEFCYTNVRMAQRKLWVCVEECGIPARKKTLHTNLRAHGSKRDECYTKIRISYVYWSFIGVL